MEQTSSAAVFNNGGGLTGGVSASNVLISDVVGRPSAINIFAGFTRDIASISARLDSSSSNSTVLAPLNAEIYKLPRKPWEHPSDYEQLGAQAYTGQQGEDRANDNLKRFIETHIVPESPWDEGRKVETLAGGKLWWEGGNDGKKVVGSALAHT